MTGANTLPRLSIGACRPARHAGSSWLAPCIALAALVMLTHDARAQQADFRIRPDGARHTWPALTERNGVILAAWLAYGADTVAMMGRIEHDADLRFVPVDSLLIQQWRHGVGGTLRGTLLKIRAAGGECAVRDVSDWMFPGDSGYQRRQYLRCAFPTQGGWRDAHLVDSSAEQSYTLDLISSQRDAASGISLHTAGYHAGAGATRLSLVAVDAAGADVWRGTIAVDPTPELVLIPIAGDRVIAASAVGAEVYCAGIRERSVSWDGAYIAGARYLRLRGAGLLRWHSSNGSAIQLTLLDTALAVKGTGTVTVPGFGSAEDVTFVEDPRGDALVCVVATLSGVVARSVSMDLQPVGPVRTVSKGMAACNRPSAVIRNDSLYVMWEDTRSGNDDVYMNVIELRLPSGVARTGAAPQSARLLPSPANERCIVRFPGPLANGCAVTVVDCLARPVLHARADRGAGHVELDTRVLPAGYYQLIISGITGPASFPLVVAH